MLSGNNCLHIYDQTIHVNDELRSYTRLLRHNFELGITNDIKLNPKKFWQYVKSRLNTSVTINDIRNDNNDLVANDYDKAELFNSYFCSVFTDEDSHSLPPFGVSDTVTPIDTVDISLEVVYQKLSSVNISKSAGPDGWPPMVLKETADSISLPLYILFTKSINAGTLPVAWKQGHVTPIYKKGPRCLVQNYRPITLTSIIGKILESIISDALLNHFNHHSLLNANQHGFVPKRSCTSQLLMVLEDWTRAIQRNSYSDVIYLDFSKAFDTVPHKRLLHKLLSYGVQGSLFMWITSFLSNRFQRVAVNNSYSDWKPVTSGVPQGSVLGPLLFAIYVNDMPSVVSSKLFKFADDTKLYRTISSPLDIQTLQNDLDLLYNWSIDWLLRFNISKCKAMHIGRFTSDDYTYFINNQPLPTVELEKDLGVFVDDHLKFHDHTAAVVAKANRILAIISKSFANLDLLMFPILFKVLVRPILEYGNAVWGPFFVTDQIAIEKVQRRATKLVTSIRELPYNERLSTLKLPSLYYRRRRGDMILVYQIFHGLIDINPSIFFAPATVSTTRGHNYKIFKPHSQCLTRSNFFSNRVINDWNSLPTNIVNANSINNFKSLLDEHWKNSFYNYL